MMAAMPLFDESESSDNDLCERFTLGVLMFYTPGNMLQATPQQRQPVNGIVNFPGSLPTFGWFFQHVCTG